MTEVGESECQMVAFYAVRRLGLTRVVQYYPSLSDGMVRLPSAHWPRFTDHRQSAAVHRIEWKDSGRLKPPSSLVAAYRRAFDD